MGVQNWQRRAAFTFLNGAGNFGCWPSPVAFYFSTRQICVISLCRRKNRRKERRGRFPWAPICRKRKVRRQWRKGPGAKGRRAMSPHPIIMSRDLSVFLSVCLSFFLLLFLFCLDGDRCMYRMCVLVPPFLTSRV